MLLVPLALLRVVVTGVLLVSLVFLGFLIIAETDVLPVSPGCCT